MNKSPVQTNERQRVLISTLHPLGSNYGGVLQAYALQKVIAQLGYDVRTINSAEQYARLRWVARMARWALTRLRRKGTLPLPLTPGERALQEHRTRSFIESEIRTCDLFGLSSTTRQLLLDTIYAIVVGSDQVWRGGYANVRHQLLDYTRDRRLVRISYAASFGASNLIRYSRGLKKDSRELASAFDALSVREDSAVALCANHWGRVAEVHLDPTMLLSRSDYMELIKATQASLKDPDGELLSYVLDQSPAVTKLVDGVAQRLEMRTYRTLPPSPSSRAALYQNQHRYALPPVEQWLNDFANAKFVITDSFHGTVFSIIFNKPFLTIGNSERGLARFETLLNTFHLSTRLVSAYASPAELDLTQDLPWPQVDAKLATERARSIKYLTDALSVHNQPRRYHSNRDS